MPSFTITILTVCSVIVLFFFLRWVFSINKIIKNQDTIISLISLIAKNQGVSREEINKLLDKPDAKIEEPL